MSKYRIIGLSENRIMGLSECKNNAARRLEASEGVFPSRSDQQGSRRFVDVFRKSALVAVRCTKGPVPPAVGRAGPRQRVLALFPM